MGMELVLYQPGTDTPLGWYATAAFPSLPFAPQTAILRQPTTETPLGWYETVPVSSPPPHGAILEQPTTVLLCVRQSRPKDLRAPEAAPERIYVFDFLTICNVLL